jgi:hypothetical protein
MKVFPINFKRAFDWKKVGMISRETLQATTPFGPFILEKKYLGDGFVLTMPNGFIGNNEIDCDSREEAFLKASEAISSRVNAMLSASEFDSIDES